MFGNAIEQALQAASNYLVFYYSAHTCRNNSEKAEGGKPPNIWTCYTSVLWSFFERACVYRELRSFQVIIFSPPSFRFARKKINTNKEWQQNQKTFWVDVGIISRNDNLAENCQMFLFKKSKFSLLSANSVTRWLDYSYNIWSFTTKNFCTIV